MIKTFICTQLQMDKIFSKLCYLVKIYITIEMNFNFINHGYNYDITIYLDLPLMANL